MLHRAAARGRLLWGEFGVCRSQECDPWGVKGELCEPYTVLIAADYDKEVDGRGGAQGEFLHHRGEPASVTGGVCGGVWVVSRWGVFGGSAVGTCIHYACVLGSTEVGCYADGLEAGERWRLHHGGVKGPGRLARRWRGVGAVSDGVRADARQESSGGAERGPRWGERGVGVRVVRSRG